MRLIYTLVLVPFLISFGAEDKVEWPISARDRAALSYLEVEGRELARQRKALDDASARHNKQVMETIGIIASELGLQADEAARLTWGPSRKDTNMMVFYLQSAGTQ